MLFRSESKYSNFVQDFINSRKNNLNQFVLSDDFKFNITNDITSLNGNNENNLIYDNDNNILLIGKIRDTSNNPIYSFLFSLNNISIPNDMSGNPQLNLIASTPIIQNVNNPLFNNGVLTIQGTASQGNVYFPADKTENKNSKLIAYSDDKGYGFGIKLENGNKKMIAYQKEISDKLKSFYPEHYKILIGNTFSILIGQLQDYLKTYKK